MTARGGRGTVRGQSIIEYLAVAMTLIAVVWMLAPRIRSAAQGIMAQARGQLLSPAATADSIIP